MYIYVQDIIDASEDENGKPFYVSAIVDTWFDAEDAFGITLGEDDLIDTYVEWHECVGVSVDCCVYKLWHHYDETDRWFEYEPSEEERHAIYKALMEAYEEE